jgi:hypothetical protein
MESAIDEPRLMEDGDGDDHEETTEFVVPPNMPLSPSPDMLYRKEASSPLLNAKSSRHNQSAQVSPDLFYSKGSKSSSPFGGRSPKHSHRSSARALSDVSEGKQKTSSPTARSSKHSRKSTKASPAVSDRKYPSSPSNARSSKRSPRRAARKVDLSPPRSESLESDPETEETVPISISSPVQSFSFEINLPPEANVSPLSSHESVIGAMIAKSVDRALECSANFAEIQSARRPRDRIRSAAKASPRDHHERRRRKSNGGEKQDRRRSNNDSDDDDDDDDDDDENQHRRRSNESEGRGDAQNRRRSNECDDFTRKPSNESESPDGHNMRRSNESEGLSRRRSNESQDHDRQDRHRSNEFEDYDQQNRRRPEESEGNDQRHKHISNESEGYHQQNSRREIDRVNVSPVRKVVADVKQTSAKTSAKLDEVRGGMERTKASPSRRVLEDAKDTGPKRASNWEELQRNMERVKASPVQARTCPTRSSKWGVVVNSADLIKETKIATDDSSGGCQERSSRRSRTSDDAPKKWEGLKSGMAFIKATRSRSVESRRRRNNRDGSPRVDEPSPGGGSNRASITVQTSPKRSSKGGVVRNSADLIKETKIATDDSSGGCHERSSRRSRTSDDAPTKWEGVKSGMAFIKATRSRSVESRRRRNNRDGSPRVDEPSPGGGSNRASITVQTSPKRSSKWGVVRNSADLIKETKIATDDSSGGCQERSSRRSRTSDDAPKKWEGLKSGMAFIKATRSRSVESRRRRNNRDGSPRVDGPSPGGGPNSHVRPQVMTDLKEKGSERASKWTVPPGEIDRVNVPPIQKVIADVKQASAKPSAKLEEVRGEMERTKASPIRLVLEDAKDTGSKRASKWEELQRNMERVKASPVQAKTSITVQAASKHSMETSPKRSSKWGVVRNSADLIKETKIATDDSSGRHERSSRRSGTSDDASKWEGLRSGMAFIKETKRRSGKSRRHRDNRDGSPGVDEPSPGGGSNSHVRPPKRDGTRKKPSETDTGEGSERRGSSRGQQINEASSDGGGSKLSGFTSKLEEIEVGEGSQRRGNHSSSGHQVKDASKWSGLRGKLAERGTGEGSQRQGARSSAPRVGDASKWEALKGANTFINNAKKQTDESKRRRSRRTGGSQVVNEASSGRELEASRWKALKGASAFINQAKIHREKSQRRLMQLDESPDVNRSTPGFSTSDQPSKWSSLRRGVGALKEAQKKATGETEKDAKSDSGSTNTNLDDGCHLVQPRIKPAILSSNKQPSACSGLTEGIGSFNSESAKVQDQKNTAQDTYKLPSKWSGLRHAVAFISEAKKKLEGRTSGSDAPASSSDDNPGGKTSAAVFTGSKWDGLNKIISETKQRAENSRHRRRSMDNAKVENESKKRAQRTRYRQKSVVDVIEESEQKTPRPAPKVEPHTPIPGKDGCVLISPKVRPVILGSSLNNTTGGRLSESPSKWAALKKSNDFINSTKKEAKKKKTTRKETAAHAGVESKPATKSTEPMRQMEKESSNSREGQTAPASPSWNGLRKASDLINEKKKRREDSRARQKTLDSPTPPHASREIELNNVSKEIEINMDDGVSKLTGLQNRIETNETSGEPPSRWSVLKVHMVSDREVDMTDTNRESEVKKHVQVSGLKNEVEPKGPGDEPPSRWSVLQAQSMESNRDSDTGDVNKESEDKTDIQVSVFPDLKSGMETKKAGKTGPSHRDVLKAGSRDRGGASKWNGLKGGKAFINKTKKVAEDNQKKGSKWNGLKGGMAFINKTKKLAEEDQKKGPKSARTGK